MQNTVNVLIVSWLRRLFRGVCTSFARFRGDVGGNVRLLSFEKRAGAMFDDAAPNPTGYRRSGLYQFVLNQIIVVVENYFPHTTRCPVFSLYMS